MKNNNTYDYAVIGAGIVGLSTALHLRKQNVTVVVLEKEKKPGLHQSGRNSGVIHSGIYYKPNSSKSELSIRGRNLLIEYLKKKEINFRQEGKIVVDNDLNKLENLLERSIELDMEGVKIVRDDELLSNKLSNLSRSLSTTIFPSCRKLIFFFCKYSTSKFLPFIESSDLLEFGL